MIEDPKGSQALSAERFGHWISHDEWSRRSMCHSLRMCAITRPVRIRKARGEPHPVEDFLFKYYPFPLSMLETWHPGYGLAVEWGDREIRPPFRSRFYKLENGVIAADPSVLSDKERARLWWIVDLLERTEGRAPNFGCHGLHEWAMVYRGSHVRHGNTMTLRLSQQEIDAFVESRPIHCSHFDAFRFFAPEAVDFNRLRPTLDGRAEMEQPACVHANMDLYKWAAKSMPWIGSCLLADAFELAIHLRALDMRASPYDVTAYGLEPVRVETAEGRKEYESVQRDLAGKASGIRLRLVRELRRILNATQTPCQPSFCRRA